LDKISALRAKGVTISNPESVEIGEQVEVNQISGNGVTLHPGCRIRGRSTVISSGCNLGVEGPVTVDECQLGKSVSLKAGFFQGALFLEGANMGSGAHVRQGTILEEEANGAHTVGLKQTILLPFVTLGSLINFCDCLMAGGTSRKDHSEVGSSYIHFNFTPDAHKATASLIGDVPRGVMMNQPRIFLGGQGGLVGPVRLGFGTVIGAGAIYRKDCLEDGKLILVEPPKQKKIDYVPNLYPGIERLFENNLQYIGNLYALEQWYSHVRRPCFLGDEFGEQLLDSGLSKLKSALAERKKRLAALLKNLDTTSVPERFATQIRKDLFAKRDEIMEKVSSGQILEVGTDSRDAFLEGLEQTRSQTDGSYVATIQALEKDQASTGTDWLQKIVEETSRQAWSVLN
jgi:UDP-N-acetylglucosamine/UDP-N-acetylgalactosamine diphosphorylase